MRVRDREKESERAMKMKYIDLYTHTHNQRNILAGEGDIRMILSGVEGVE